MDLLAVSVIAVPGYHDCCPSYYHSYQFIRIVIISSVIFGLVITYTNVGIPIHAGIRITLNIEISVGISGRADIGGTTSVSIN